ncbi:glycosyltransferase family protein [Viridibacillus sp. YIM B01967]|uniref:Glycosyltransferase family protein n=1 Tax=Viridibacillus soli TaxID=2798301 RepID=A0ABS1H615_9BACL|nr:glycosyltransferase family protein [Viridibacillus soli]MBK3494836.1 glycosyltransferase family protein [Viridibacillus soli]
MKIVGIVQARMGSTRLPGKVMKEINGIPLLEYQIERMQRSKLIDEIVIATTSDNNDPIIQLCTKLNVSYFEGSEQDVLERYYNAAEQYDADLVVRMTSDCPLIDPEIIDSVIQYYCNNEYDYVSNTQTRTFPRGMDTEVFSMNALRSAFFNANEAYEREHVTPHLYLNSDKYTIGQYINSEKDISGFRLTVDTPEDFKLISIILLDLYKMDKHFDLEMIIEKLENNPELIKINANIQQKKLGE